MSEQEIPLEYVSVMAKVGEAVKNVLDNTVFGESFDIDRITFWDGSLGEKSNFALDYHDGSLWFVQINDTEEN